MKKILSLLSLLMLCVLGVNAQTALIDYPTSKDGIAISGTTTEGTVKIHTNKDGVACYTLKNGYTTEGVMNGNHIKLTLEGGFKKGDVRALEGFIKWDGPPITQEQMDEAIAEACAEGCK